MKSAANGRAVVVVPLFLGLGDDLDFGVAEPEAGVEGAIFG